MTAYQRAPGLRLRPTARGGAAFLPDTATTADLDAEGFALLALLEAPLTARALRRLLVARLGRNVTVAAVEILLRELTRWGFVSQRPDGGSPEPAIGGRGDVAGAVSPPESVHLQLNNVCNLRCPSCYVGLEKEDVGSLPPERLRALIDEWAQMGVFQLALGGGEPLLSPNFVPVVCHARRRGLVPNVTTNGWLITEPLLREIQGRIGEVRLSLNDAISADRALLSEKAALMRGRRVRFGFNLIVTRPNLDRLRGLLRWARTQGAATINLIRPKPAPGNAAWYTRNALRPEDALRLSALLRELEGECRGVDVTVDCAFSYLFRGLPPEELQRRGIVGCPMGDRFATVRWNGDLYPCSHLHDHAFCAGSVRTESFRALWERSDLFQRIRRELGKVEGHCGECDHNRFCKGCRAVMQLQTGRWLAPDDECAFAPRSEPASPRPGRRAAAVPLPMLEPDARSTG